MSLRTTSKTALLWTAKATYNNPLLVGTLTAIPLVAIGQGLLATSAMATGVVLRAKNEGSAHFRTLACRVALVAFGAWAVADGSVQYYQDRDTNLAKNIVAELPKNFMQIGNVAEGAAILVGSAIEDFNSAPEPVVISPDLNTDFVQIAMPRSVDWQNDPMTSQAKAFQDAVAADIVRAIHNNQHMDYGDHSMTIRVHPDNFNWSLGRTYRDESMVTPMATSTFNINGSGRFDLYDIEVEKVTGPDGGAPAYRLHFSPVNP